MRKRRIALAITGASGAIYAKGLMEKLQAMQAEIELALVMSRNAADVWKHELGEESYRHYMEGNLAASFRQYHLMDYQAPFASGSSRYEALVVIPCSMGTLGRMAHGISDTLITRAADVMLKERRTLICVVRDMPYNLIHLRNMQTLTEAGAIICPASPSFYSLPDSLDALAATVVDRVLDLLKLPVQTYRWHEREDD